MKEKLIFSKDYKKVEELGLINPNRWDEGVEHHPMSEKLVSFMADHDYNDYDDAMCIKTGGDGDNGEHMMYLMDAFFEMLDKDNIDAEQFLKEEIKKDFNTRQLINQLDAIYQEVLIGIMNKFKGII